MSLSPSEAAFRAALLAPGEAVPDGLLDGAGRQAGRRYAVYRNNVTVALREALETGFPAVRALIGAPRFADVARQYLRAHPPRTPCMMLYGDGFARFLAGVEPLRGLGYLPDVARLEYALRGAYHAAFATPLDPGALARLDPEALARRRLRLAPAARLVRSPWPVHAIWTYALQGGDAPQAVAQDVLVGRPGLDPVARVLPAGGADFVAALAAGHPFADAAEAAGPGTDLAAVLGVLFETAALSAAPARSAAP